MYLNDLSTGKDNKSKLLPHMTVYFLISLRFNYILSECGCDLSHSFHGIFKYIHTYIHAYYVVVANCNVL